MKNNSNIKIPGGLLMRARFSCDKGLATTDFNFSEDRIANTKVFKQLFTMKKNQGMIALEAALLGYNDNLN
jgi:hypothetical protein